jgi:hypothetical protein
MTKTIACSYCGVVLLVVFFTAGFGGLVVSCEPVFRDPPSELALVARLITSVVAVEGAVETVVTYKESTFLVVTTDAGGTYQLLSPASRN